MPTRMRRPLPRILLNTSAAASLVLCAATLVLWVRSGYGGDYFDFVSADRRHNFTINAGQGLLMLKWTTYSGPLTGPAGASHTSGGFYAIVWNNASWRLPTLYDRPRFKVLAGRVMRFSDWGWCVVLPLWVVASASALPPTCLAVARALRKRR
jgi:hypothetical protein